MWQIIVKELTAALLLMGLAALIVFYETGHLPHSWFFLSVFIALIFPAATLVLNSLKKLSSQAPGWALLALSSLKMILIPTLIFILFDREHEATPAVVMPTVIAYLILLGLDTYWKVKWLFGK